MRAVSTQVYVQPSLPGKPAPPARWQVSTEPAHTPAWRSDGKELFYQTADTARLMSAAVTVRGDVFESGKPASLFPRRSGMQFDVSPDGRRFLMLGEVDSDRDRVQPMTIVLNWQSALRR